ncbi:hypothetical protein C0J52_02843 [Blattella germanica]|nr:hypothetical protein C0J52_02843 [Blattella germanica]
MVLKVSIWSIDTNGDKLRIVIFKTLNKFVYHKFKVYSYAHILICVILYCNTYQGAADDVRVGFDVGNEEKEYEEIAVKVLPSAFTRDAESGHQDIAATLSVKDLSIV